MRCAATAVATIALGIGATTAIFSVTNAVLLQPLPYKNPERLVLAAMDFKKANLRDHPFNNPAFFDLRSATTSVFEDMTAISTYRVMVPRDDGTPERIFKAMVMPNFFRMMGAQVILGRDFTEADSEFDATAPEVGIPQGSIAILSFEYWQRRYGGNPGVIGHEMISYANRGPIIVGVLSPGFKLFFPASSGIEARPDVWVANNQGDDRNRSYLALRVAGRLRAGVTLKRAREQVAAFAAQLPNEPNDSMGHLEIRLEPMLKYLVAQVQPAILALNGAVLFLLLIACANVANLLLVRASSRERELAVRAALGASGWRLMGQMLAEAGLLAGFGTVAGLGLGWLGVRELVAIAPADLPRLDAVAIDWRVLGFAAITGLGAAAIFGVIPAFRASRPDLIRVLRGGGRSANFRPGRLLRNTMVIVEVALSFVLLIGSGLMFRSFLELRRIDPGFDPHHLLTFLLVRNWDYSSSPEKREALFGAIQSRLRAIPGVENASESLARPPADGLGWGLQWATEDASADPARHQPADLQNILPGYFETLRVRLIEGRTFSDSDNAPGRNVAVIDEFLAAKAFPKESAVGKRIVLALQPPLKLEVIGVVAHQRLGSLAEPGREQIYVTDGFLGFGVGRNWAVRTSGDPAKMAPVVRSELARLDPQLLPLEMKSMDAIVEHAEAGTRFSLLLIGVFAAIAALLASVGLYGVLSTVVEQRTAEIGVRMALGAAPASIFTFIVGHGLRLSALGIAIGLAAAVGLTRVMTSMLVGVRATDPTTFVAIAVLFLLISAVASWMPARRAAGLDPIAALREE